MEIERKYLVLHLPGPLESYPAVFWSKAISIPAP